MSVTTYCTWQDVQTRISAEAAEARTDDDPSSQTGVLEDAATEVNGYLGNRYPVSSLAQSQWVRTKTRDIAVFMLCLRRNHPPPTSVVERYETAIKQLEAIEIGQKRLPDIYEPRGTAPVLTNQRVQMWPVPRVVNVDGTSTGKKEGYTAFSDTTDQLDYSI